MVSQTLSLACDGSELRVRIYQKTGVKSHYSYGVCLVKKVKPKANMKVSTLTGKVEHAAMSGNAQMKPIFPGSSWNKYLE
jgi:hypothetical protein